QVESGGTLVVAPIEDADPMEVTCEWLDDMVRVRMTPRHPENAGFDTAPGLPLSTIDHAPYPAWWLDADGRLCWENGAMSACGSGSGTQHQHRRNRCSPLPPVIRRTAPACG